MEVLATFGQNYTMKPSDIVNLAKNILLFDSVTSFLNTKMMQRTNFGQIFGIFCLKSLKIAVFGVVFAKGCYKTS